MSVIICISTGTMLAAETCRIVPDAAFTDAEWDGMDDRSDTEIAAFGRDRGRPVVADAQALDALAVFFSATEWSSELVATAVDMIRATGRTVEDT